MSGHDFSDPIPGDRASAMAIEMLIVPRAVDLGEMTVRRALPSTKRQMVGPFIFFDQMGPAEFLTDTGIDVRPHPHINLATITYLFEGEILHRDSLGTEQVIQPGAVNWMSAGRGIVHSERTGAERKRHGQKLFGIQTWLALPDEAEEGAPSFVHHAAPSLPTIMADGVSARLIAGARLRRAFATRDDFGDPLRRRRLCRPAHPCPSTPDMRSAQSTRSPARSRSRETGSRQGTC